MKEAGVNPRCGEDLSTKRKPLKGNRRVKRNISKEEKRRLAETMKRWLGKQHVGVQDLN